MKQAAGRQAATEDFQLEAGREYSVRQTLQLAPQFKTKPASPSIHAIGQLVEVDRRRSDPIVRRFCSGFNITAGGLFLSAGHCFADEYQCSDIARIRGRGRTLNKYQVVFNYHGPRNKVNSYNIQSVEDSGVCVPDPEDEKDFILLQLDTSGDKLPFLNPILNSPIKGSSIMSVSHPEGGYKKISVGTVSKVSLRQEVLQIDHTSWISPGSSGSPLIGSLTGQYEERLRTFPLAVGINVSVSVSARDQRVDHKHHYAVPMKAIAEQSDKVKNVSYLLSRQGIFKNAMKAEESGLEEQDIVHQAYSYPL